MELSANLKKRFCKDNGIALKIYSEPIFTERLKLFGQLDKYRQFEELIQNEFKGVEEDYFKASDKFIQDVINKIKSYEAYSVFCNETYDSNLKHQVSKCELYKPCNVGHKFISIDIRSANFNALVHYGKTHNCEFYPDYDYDKFVEQFTPVEYFRKSKYIRQVIFGNCNSKRQINYEKKLICLLIDELISEGLLDDSSLYAMNNDELIIQADTIDTKDIERIQRVVDKFSEDAIPLNMQYFVLGRVTETKAYIKKNLLTGEIVVKCAGHECAPFVYRTLAGESIQKYDYVFWHDGLLAEFIKTRNPEIVF